MKLVLQHLDWQEVKDELLDQYYSPGNAGVVSVGLEKLEEVLGEDLSFISLSRAEDVQLLADAFNCAAKRYSESFYNFKADAVELSVLLGAKGGWVNDVFYIETEEVGQTSYHDPFDQIEIDGQYDKKWTGIRRQDFAIATLFSDSLKRLFAETNFGGVLEGISNSAVERAARRLLKGSNLEKFVF